MINANPFTDNKSSLEATTETADPVPQCGNGSRDRSVWYRFTAPYNTMVTADTLGSNYDTILSVFTRAAGVLAARACSDNVLNTQVSAVSLAVVAGTTYYFMVTSVSGSGGSTVFHFAAPVGGGGASIATRTFQSGSLLYLETTSEGNTTRLGLETQWGGTIVELSLNGTNFVNHSDPGREVQVALYDGNAQYDNCAGCSGVFGWDPVQGGDKYGHGSPVLAQALANDFIWIKTQPYHWNPDDKGGGPSQPVLGDVLYEQMVARVPGHAQALRVQYRLTHIGTDEHANAVQEFPAVYANLGYDTFAYYGGTSPWTNEPLTFTALPDLPDLGELYAPEQWGAYVDNNGVGLTVYVPGQYPYNYGGHNPGTSGPSGTGTNYYRPLTFFTLEPNMVLEGGFYVVAGAVTAARQVIYELRNSPVQDIFTPFGFLDVPAADSTVSGMTTVAGWSFDNAEVAQVEVFVDDTLAGAATYGIARPDVPAVIPHAPLNVGYEFMLDTTHYTNGPHVLKVKVTDTANNVAIFPQKTININN
ncbi:MAG: Ig-like domain-containing protein [Terriglobales bacterium]